MQKKIFLALVLLFASETLYAQNVDINEFQPLPTETKASGWDNGFYIRSADDNFKMKIGGRVQVQQDIYSKQGQQKIFDPTSNTFITPDTFSDTFMLRRGTIQTSGTVFEKVDFATLVQTRTGSSGNADSPQSFLFLADVAYNVSPYLFFDMGTIQLPFEKDISSAWLLGVEPAITATQVDGLSTLTIARQAFGPSYDLGVVVGGSLGPVVSWSGSAINGNGISAINTDNNLSYGGRLQFDILGKIPGSQTDFEPSTTPKLMLGLGTNFEDVEAQDSFNPSITRLWDWSSVADAAFRFNGLAINGAFYYRKSKYSPAGSTPDDTNSDGYFSDYGYYANAGYYVIPKKLEFQLSAAQIGREGPDNDSYEYGGGINWYIHNNFVKLQIDYGYVLDYDAVPGVNNAVYNRIRTMFSLIL